MVFGMHVIVLVTTVSSGSGWVALAQTLEEAAKLPACFPGQTQVREAIV